MATVNKDELASILTCSLPTLSAMMKLDGFPIVETGGRGREYKFDPAAVTEFLRARENDRLRLGAERDELMRQYTLPVEAPADIGVKPADLLTLARVRRLAREEELESGFLVRTSEVRATLTTLIASLRRDMATSIRQSLRDSNIPEPTIRTIEARIAEAQRRFVQEARSLLEEGAHHVAEPALL